MELAPLCEFEVRLRTPHYLPGTPAGTRMIFEAESGEVRGERLRGTLAGQCTADWLVMGPDGTGTLDVRALIRTDDDALVYIHYLGRTDLSGGPETGVVRAAPLFETGDERYAWLNRVVSVAKGRLEEGRLTYQIHELR